MHGNDKIVSKDQSPKFKFRRSHFEEEVKRRINKIEIQIENIHKLLK